MIDGENRLVWVIASAAGLLLVWFLTVPIHAYAPRFVQFFWSRVIRAVKGKKKKPWNPTVVMDTDKESPTLVLGSMPLSMEHLEELSCDHGGKLAVLSMNASWELVLEESELKTMGIDFLRLPTPDFFAPSIKDIERGVEFIEKELSLGTSVLCHCNAGRGRSAVVVLCFLIKNCGMSLSDAFAHVKSRRKIAKLNVCCGLRPQWRACKGYDRRLRSMTKDMPKAPSQNNWTQDESPTKAGP